jgi:hypothetical protein
MNEAQLAAAVRSVEWNPVRAKLVSQAKDLEVIAAERLSEALGAI